jgi:hypothetical protein
MFPPLVGALLVLGSLGVAGMGLGALVLGRLRREPRWTRAGARLVGIALVGYAALWMAGLAGTPRRALALGDELSFCGLDCHLHVSVVRADRTNDLAVTVRFRSDARAVDEYPGLLRIEVVDSAGRRYAPSAGMIAEPLGPGATIEREFRFAVPAEAPAPTLVVSQGGWLDYLLPGRGNPLAQRRTRLALGAT